MKNTKNPAQKSSKTENQKFDFIKMLSEIQTEIQKVREILPSDLRLTPKNRKSLQQVGPRRWPFVETALEVAVEKPYLVPDSQDKEKIEELKNMFHVLKEAQRELEILVGAFENMRFIKSNECYKMATRIYNWTYAKGKDEHQDAWKVYEQLKTLRTKRKKKKNDLIENNLEAF